MDPSAWFVRVPAGPLKAPYHPPVKRSLVIDGHKTSISLEPLFWDMLKTAAACEGLAMARLVTRIDAERIKAEPAPGLAGAVRVWLVTNLQRTNERGGRIAPPAPAEVASIDQ